MGPVGCIQVAAVLAAVAAGGLVPERAAAAWPVERHDPQQTARSGAVSAQQPRLLPGWPIAALGPMRVTPNGTLTLPVGDDRREAILGRDGLHRRLGGARAVRAIGPDGRRYAFADSSGDRVVTWSPSGARLWVSALVNLGPEASERGIVPGPGGAVVVTGDRGIAVLDGRGRVLARQDDGLGNVGAVAVGADGAIFHGFEGSSPDHQVVARDPAGDVQWVRAMPGRVNALALSGAIVVVAHDRADARGGAAIRALSAHDGSEVWSVPTGRAAASPPAVGARGEVYATVAGALWAIQDGRVAWRVGRSLHGGPVIGGDGTIYAGGSPLTAVRPGGTVLWRLPSRSAAIPQAIGADGSLYVEQRGGILLALAPPGSRSRAIAGPQARPLIAGLALGSGCMRTSGPVSLCRRGPGSCRPATPLGTTIRVRLARAAVVTLVARPVDSNQEVGRLNLRLPAGVSWWSARDLVGRRAAPGAYRVSARAAAGPVRMGAGPITLHVVG